MPKFVVERFQEGIGSRGKEYLRKTARDFQAVAEQLDEGITWTMSFVTENAMYCVFSAPNAESIRFHGLRTGLPADQISQVKEILEPEKPE